jgi:hypothetical protein
MSPSSPSLASLSDLIFYCGETESDDPHEGERREGPSNDHQQSGDTSEKKPNVYVELFEGMSPSGSHSKHAEDAYTQKCSGLWLRPRLIYSTFKNSITSRDTQHSRVGLHHISCFSVELNDT